MTEPSDRIYHIGLAVASLEGLFQPPLEEALRRSWVAGTTVTRYRRTWHLSRIHGESPYALSGQTGFVSETAVQTMFFDYTTGDFVKGAAPSGTIVPFAIRLEDGLVAYQLRPGLVRESSFTGALQALLNTPALEFVWIVRQAVEKRTWDQWRSDMETVSGFTIRVDRPNPYYGHDHLIENAVEGIRLEYLRLSGAGTEEGIDTEADLFRQAVNHVLRDYGRAAVHGVDREGEESTWVKIKGMAGSVTSRLRLRRVGEPEVAETELVNVLQRTSTVEATADLQGLGDEREE